MNFDSIEGLSDEAINELYFDEEKLVEWYGTFCKTVYADENSNCVSFFTRYAHSGHCALDCANSITFTADAMKAKCAELCGGGAEIALEANVHKNAHSASYVIYRDGGGIYCHKCNSGSFVDSSGYNYEACYQGHYHSCHEAMWHYAGYGNFQGYCNTITRHEHPWPIAWARCTTLLKR